jgi:uncharacterized protein YbjT (DUF2867 family)
LGSIAQAGTLGQTLRASPALFQPIAADDVAATLATVGVSPPVNGIVEVAGPERVRLAELVQRFLIKTGDSRQVLADSSAHYFGAVLSDRSLPERIHALVPPPSKSGSAHPS